MSDRRPSWRRTSRGPKSEALTAFGNAAVFVERYVEAPRHVEVQILSDGETTFHLYERDCSVQRRFQKVVEIAPSVGLPEELQKALHDDAVRLTSAAGYTAPRARWSS